MSDLVVVEGFRATGGQHINLLQDALSVALDQRAFGPRRLVVAFANRRGRLLALAHARRTDPPELALGPCIEHLGRGAAAAVAYCDEPVVKGPPPPEVAIRFAHARSIADSFGVFLVDWFACDDDLFRSAQMAVEPDGQWWALPPRR